MAVCPYCKDIVAEEDALFCPVCEASHHPECWEFNKQTCSVYGCTLPVDETLRGCPFCEETATGDQRRCNSCGQPMMNASEIAEFLDSHDWQILPTNDDLNPTLTAGYLRNGGILARLSKRAPISMFGFSPKITVWVPVEQLEEAQSLLGTLSERFQACPSCGHTLFIDEEECSYCMENSGAEA